MRTLKITLLLAFLIILQMPACQARQEPLPAPTIIAATNTLAPIATNTATATFTPFPSPTTPAATDTPEPTITPTPLPGIGIGTADAIGLLAEFFTFTRSEPVDDQPAQKGISQSGFSSVILIGEPYLMQAELVVDLSAEEEPALTAYWVAFLEYTAHGKEEIMEWVRDNFREAVKNGNTEQTFGNIHITMQVSGGNSQILTLKVVPAGR